jgi:hypothetical protein
MSYRELPPAIRQMNEALDRKRAAHAITNDRELGKHLGISHKSISFIRRGRLTQMQAAIIAVLTGDQSILPGAKL